jgi:16S rRNA (uracil1498-N3)-methyltransferase
VPNPPLPSGEMILYFPRVWPLKSIYSRQSAVDSRRSITRMMRKSSRLLPRFLAPALGSAGDEVSLPAGESHHLARVLRLRAGDTVAVFDGSGREFVAEVVRADRAHATVTLRDEIRPAREPDVPFALVQALLKGTAMDEVVRDATMLGASSLEPVLSSHVTVRGAVASSPAVVERWRRLALASAKQARRAVVPNVRPPRPFGEWLNDRKQELRLLFVEPSTGCEARSLRSFVSRPKPASAALIVGPEGGWSQDEIESAIDAGCVAVTLGDLTLRADAVALAAASVIRVLWEQGPS